MFPWKRKLFHAQGVVIVGLYWGLDLGRPLAVALLGGVTVALAVLDLLRARNVAVQSFFRASFRAILDEKDQSGLNGSTLYFAGCTLAAALVPQAPACGGILALALGDPAAAVIGSNVRSPRFGRVSVAGTGACFVVATLASALFAPWPAALAGGAAAALLEAVSGSKLDNLTIPCGTALVLFLLSR